MAFRRLPEPTARSSHLAARILRRGPGPSRDQEGPGREADQGGAGGGRARAAPDLRRREADLRGADQRRAAAHPVDRGRAQAIRERGQGLPFQPDVAFDQVYAAARGWPREKEGNLRGQLFEIARILTLIAAIYVSEDPKIPEIREIERLEPLKDAIVKCILDLIARLDKKGHPEPLISRVTSNRPVEQATIASRETVKADAAYRVFDVRCKDITWAVLEFGNRSGPCRVRAQESGARRDEEPGHPLLRARHPAVAPQRRLRRRRQVQSDARAGDRGEQAFEKGCDRLSQKGLSVLQHRDPRLVLDRAAAPAGRARARRRPATAPMSPGSSAATGKKTARRWSRGFAPTSS